MVNLTKQQVLELIPQYVIAIAEKLQQAGFEAYLVGGSIRDVLLGRTPNDYDVATNAYPEDIEKIFEKSIPTGAKFGTMTVVTEDENGERYDVEVTTYRSEEDYVGGRWPAKVEFTKTIDEDLARRDFTINAIALDLQNFDTDMPIEALVKDPWRGLADLDHKIIRAVGDPIERFTEDGLRPIRACRLASQLGFQIEPVTFAAISETNHVTEQISPERMRDELLKMLLKSPQPSVGLRLMHKSGLLKIILPELEEGIGVTQPEFHAEDVFDHSLRTVDAAEDSIKLAALLHDIGKPRTMTKDTHGTHFYGHDQVGGEMTQQIMKRLRFSNAEISRTANLVRWHMFFYPSADWRKDTVGDHSEKLSDENLEIDLAGEKGNKYQGGWTDGAIRRLIKNVGGEDAIDDLFKLRIADASANPKAPFNPKEIDALADRVAEVRAKEMALKVEDLDITGHDLMQELALQPGPQLGQVLEYLLDQVIEDTALNQKDKLLQLARGFFPPQKNIRTLEH